MTDFIVKAIPIDGMNWPIRAVLQSLDSPELGEAEWWRRMAMLQNAAARAYDGMLLDVLDTKKKNRWGTEFESPEVITQNNLPPLSVDENVKRQFKNLNEDKQYEILKSAMEKLLEVEVEEGGKKLFSKKQHWMGVYIVLYYRLSIALQQNTFHIYATKITPDTCPTELRITPSTMTNFSKTTSDSLLSREENNPLRDISNMLWSIIKNLFYSKTFTNE